VPHSTDASPRAPFGPKLWAAGTGLALGLAVLGGYGEMLLRASPVTIHDVSIGYPCAALSLVLLALAACATPDSHQAWRILAQAASGLAILLILIRISDVWLGTAIIARATASGPPMPRAAAAGLLLLAVGELFQQYRHPRSAQAILAIAGFGFLLSVLGYAAGLPAFHHGIALVLGLAGCAVVLAAMSGTSGSGFLSAFQAKTPYAEVVRRALAASTLAALLLGCGFARFATRADGALLLIEALLLTAVIWSLATAAMIRFNRIERERLRAEDDLLRDATVDALTGVLSRNKMDELIAEQQRAPARAAMIVIDLDRFRSVNNALGTGAGDRLLLQAAKRLSDLAEPHRVARAGGDEFAIFCNAIGPAEANRLGQAVVETIAVPFGLGDGRHFHITASVGVAHGATDGVCDLRDAADEAMYIAKNQGGNQSVPFVCALHQARVERVGLEQDLHRAIKSVSELFLVYQPIISLRDRRIVAVEALARWQHPQGVLVAPGRFIAIAEASGMCLSLGSKLRELAVAQAARWRDKDLGPLPVINLNVSPLELARSDVPATLGAQIDRYGLQRSAFCLEVTEGSFADEHALQSLRIARDAGFKIAMDDFGVGYSSLTQLPRLPLTAVKLDRSFLDQAMESEDGISLFATMVQLAHVLKLPVVAEGVETADELSIVSDCGCDSVQGFIFSRPLNPAQLEPWLCGDHRAQAWPALAPREGRVA
jgi:diguanylate cyclase (GGDEF)-like protein